MSGDGEVRQAVHERYGDDLKHSAVVGATHHDQMAAGAGDLPGPRPAMFFAPDRIMKRGEDWGAAGMDERVIEAWKPFVEWSGGWLEVKHGEGGEALKEAYRGAGRQGRARGRARDLAGQLGPPVQALVIRTRPRA